MGSSESTDSQKKAHGAVAVVMASAVSSSDASDMIDHLSTVPKDQQSAAAQSFLDQRWAAEARVSAHREGDVSFGNANASVQATPLGARAQAGVSAVSYDNGSVTVHVASAEASAEISPLSANAQANANIASVDSEIGLSARAGVGVSVGAGIADDSFRLDLGLISFTVGRKFGIGVLGNEVGVDFKKVAKAAH